MAHNLILRDYAIDLIQKERLRQEILHPIKNKQSPDPYFLSVLVEEVGEVAAAIQDGTNIEEELIQVAAVCLRWLENRN